MWPPEYNGGPCYSPLATAQWVLTRVRCNADVDGEALEQVAVLDKAGQEILPEAIEMMRLTARGYHRILRVARTLADLDGLGNISRIHISEVLSYRQRKHIR